MTQNENTDYTTHVANTGRPPGERCALDGFKLRDPVRASCGHVYCRVCLKDLTLTAALCGGTAVCIVCGQELVEAHGTYSAAVTGGGHVKEQASEMGAATMGSSNGLMGHGSSSVPWMPQPRRVSALFSENTHDSSADSKVNEAGEAKPSQEASALHPAAAAQDGQPPEAFAECHLDHNSASIEGNQHPVPDDVDFDAFLNNFDLDQNQQFEQNLLLWDVYDPSFGDFASLLESAAEGPSTGSKDEAEEDTHPFDIDTPKQYTPPFSFMTPVASSSGGPGSEMGTIQQEHTAPSAFTPIELTFPLPFNAPTAYPPVDPSLEINKPRLVHRGSSTQESSNFTSSAPFDGSFAGPFGEQSFNYNTPRQAHTETSPHTPADFTPSLTFDGSFASPFTDAGIGPNTPQQVQIGLPQYSAALAPFPPVPTHQAPIRDISVLAGERFCFKGTLKHEAEMKAAVLANGGAVTKGGFKHTTYGVVGGKWKPTRSWVTNGIVVLSEDGFWDLLHRKTEEARQRRESVGVKEVERG